FDLPPERIAQTAVEPRDDARLLHICGQGLSDHHVYDLPELLRSGDLLVMNDTKVIPARLYGKRGKTQSRLRPVSGHGAGSAQSSRVDVSVEILLHKKQTPSTWLAFARPVKR